LAPLFSAFSRGEPSPLPDLPIQYSDFAVWQREWAEGDQLEAELEYWKRQLAGAPVLQLPGEHPSRRSATVGFHRRMWISAELKRALKALSQQEHATLFMTLAASFAVLLSRYSGQDDIVIGSPFA